MKRQRNVNPENVKATKAESTTASRPKNHAMGKKKGKKAIDQKEKLEDCSKINDGEDSCPRMVDSYINWGELPWLRGVVDEQMSWGSTWLPFWDVEYMGEAYSEMFSDVFWDYDIWNLRNINELPNP